MSGTISIIFTFSNMAKKRGIITAPDIANSREDAIRYGKVAKRGFKHLVPHRLDINTVIFINPGDREEQVSRYLARLEKDRANY